MNNLKKCCFIGHRDIVLNDLLIKNIKYVIEKLIILKDVKVFLFGSNSRFDDICYDIVSELQKKYEIKRVYVRSQYQFISDQYKNYILSFYEDTYFSNKSIKAGKIAHIKRNEQMIDESDFCVFYYNKNYNIKDKENHILNSGTYIAFKYAIKRKKTIINVFEIEK